MCTTIMKYPFGRFSFFSFFSISSQKYSRCEIFNQVHILMSTPVDDTALLLRVVRVRFIYLLNFIASHNFSAVRKSPCTKLGAQYLLHYYSAMVGAFFSTLLSCALLYTQNESVLKFQ